jgi:hypothetical protein
MCFTPLISFWKIQRKNFFMYIHNSHLVFATFSPRCVYKYFLFSFLSQPYRFEFPRFLIFLFLNNFSVFRFIFLSSFASYFTCIWIFMLRKETVKIWTFLQPTFSQPDFRDVQSLGTGIHKLFVRTERRKLFLLLFIIGFYCFTFYPTFLILKNESRLMRSPCCLCVCESPLLTIKCRNQSLWNLECISWHLSATQRRNS